MRRASTLLAVLLPAAAGVQALSPAAVAALPAQSSVVVRTVNGSLLWIVSHPESGETFRFTYGSAGDVPLWGDWDGNGTFTAGVVRGTQWYLRNEAGGDDLPTNPFGYGTTGDRPIAGDWDGNGTWTPGVIRSGTTWLLRNHNTGGNAELSFVYGRAGDRPVTGDWDGNGTFTPGMVRGNTWLLRNSNSGGANDVPAFAYEQAGDRPVPGDYDGDGRWTPAAVRDGIWLVRNDLAGGTAEERFAYGAPTDAPLHSRGRPPAPAVTPVDWARFTVPAPADEDARRIAEILRNTNRYAMVTWWPAKYQAQTGTYLSFGGFGEHQVRAPANEAFALAVSLRTGAYDPETAGVPAEEARARAVKLVRSLARWHAVNGHGWGGQWQSALWSARAAFAGWLLWEDLSPADRADLARMVEFEADRFLGHRVPYYRDRAGSIIFPGDTKAEENAWNGMILQMATSMMPGHPHHAGWLRKSVELEISSFSRPENLSFTNIVNGRPVSEWLNGTNINSDGFLINHGIVHPDYSTTVSENIHAALAHSMAGQGTPRAAFWGSDIIYGALVDKVWVAGSGYPPHGPVDPPGGTVYVDDAGHLYYPQGNDWGTNRVIQTAVLDVQARAFGFDNRASRKGGYWQRLHLQRVLNQQLRFPDRHTYLNNTEDRYPGREELVAATISEAHLTRWILAQGTFFITNDPV